MKRPSAYHRLHVALFLSSPMLTALGVPHGFSLRTGGVSAPPFASLNLGDAVGDNPASVRENQRRFLAGINVSEAMFTSVRQVHGARVLHAFSNGGGVGLNVEANQTSPAAPEEADALVAQPGTAVGIRTADCVPILLHDPQSGLSAAVHAGWKGTVALIAQRTVEVLTNAYGVNPTALRAAIGPAIGVCCFEVGNEVARHFDSDAVLAQSVDRTRGERPHIDLQTANRALLKQAGVLPAHVEVLARCTHCDEHAFFSHRRDAGRTGRHLAAIAGGRFGA